MTDRSGWRTGTAEAESDRRRFGTRCPRCARTQPPAAGRLSCAYCGAPLPVRRWVAHPPPGAGIPRRARLLRRPYAGPPGYRGGHPTWGFPAVTWRGATVAPEGAPREPRVRGPVVVVVLAGLTALACLVAAGAESWRFALLLAGRTRVLDGGPVRASDTAVGIAGTAALVLGVVTALVALPALVTWHRASALRAGFSPARSGPAVLARLVVPGWNLYGAGQVLMEITGMLAGSDSRRRGARVTVPLWWLAWVGNGLLTVATLVMAFGRSNQMMADTVEMHIALDVVAALVAALFAAAIGSLWRSWTGRGAGRYDGWSVRPPVSTARNRASHADGEVGQAGRREDRADQAGEPSVPLR